MNVGELAVFVAYLVAMLGIGVFFFFKSKNAGGDKEYFLGGRSMGPWVTAMSAQASDMSAWLLMGLPGSIIAFGMGQVWIAIGLALGTAANWIFIARRLRRFSQASNDSITLPQYLTNRFASSNPALKVICAIVFLIAFTVYVSSAFVAGRDVLKTLIPDLDSTVAIVIFAVIILVYTFLGGYKAVCWTDFFQGILMLCALLSVPIIMYTCGDFGGKELLGELNGAAGTAFQNNIFSASWADIASGLGWGLGYFGMPHILVRFMAIKKPSMVKKSGTVAIIWLIISLGSAVALAILGRTWLFADGTSLAQAIVPEQRTQVFIRIVEDIFPGAVAGILLAAIIAASMSTADSQLLVASSSFTSDIYKPLRKGKASEKEVLWVGRIVVAIVAVVAFFIATSGSEWAGDIMNMVENAWGLFGAAFGPVVILSLFWKRFNFPGALAGIVAGAVADIAWLLCFTSTISDAIVYNTGLYEIIPGFVFGLIVAVIVTLITKAPGEEVMKIYESATSDNDDVEVIGDEEEAAAIAETAALTEAAAEETTEAVEETAEVAEAAVEETAEAVEETAEEAEAAVEETTEAVEETAEVAEAAVEETTEAVEETAEVAEAAVEETTEAVEETAEVAEAAVEETTEAVEETAEVAEAAVEETVEAVQEAIEKDV